MVRTKDYTIDVNDQINEYTVYAAKKDTLYIRGLQKENIDTSSFIIKNNFLYFKSFQDKKFYVYDYKNIKYLKFDNRYYETELINIIENAYIDNSENPINSLNSPYYNKNKLTVTGTNYNDKIDFSDAGYIPSQSNKKKNKGITINAGNGNDKITGTEYNDTIKGGSGKNTIVINDIEFGNDVVNLTKDEELIIDMTECKSITDISDLEYNIVGKNLIIMFPSDDETQGGSLTLKNYTKDVLKSISFILYNQDTLTFNNFKELTRAIVFDYNNDDFNKKGILTTSDNNDRITISPSNKKYTINAGGGINTINIDNSDEFGTITINEQKVNAVNNIVFKEDLSELIFEKNNDDLKIRDDYGQVVIKSYFAELDEKSITTLTIGGEKIDINKYMSENMIAIGGSGKIYGTDNSEYIIPDNKKVSIYAGKGDDIIKSSKGNRTIYLYEGDGDDIVERGGGVDTLMFEKNTKVSSEVVYDLDGVSNLIVHYGTKGDTVTFKDYQSSDKIYYYIGNKKYSLSSLIKKENTIDINKYKTHYDGTEENDKIVDSFMHSLENSITIFANGGDDYIDAHHDIVYAGSGDDVIHSIDSYIFGGDGNDTIINYGYNDFNGNSTNVELFGGNDNDTITSLKYASAKNIYGNDGDDIISNSGKVTGNIDGGNGKDDIASRSGSVVSNTIYGGSGDDKITVEVDAEVSNICGDSDKETMEGDGNDEIHIYGKVGSIYTTGGDDTVTVYKTGNVSSTIDVGVGNNIVDVFGTVQEIKVGEEDEDEKIIAGNNIITLYEGGILKNDLTTYDGDDIINIESTNKNKKENYTISIDTGAGDDIVNISEISKIGNVDLGSGNNTINVYGRVNSISTGQYNDDNEFVSGEDNITLYKNAVLTGNITTYDGNDIITIGNIEHKDNAISISSGDGDDRISISEGSSVNNINAGKGDDIITNDGFITGNISFVNGDGHDTLYLNKGENKLTFPNLNALNYSWDKDDLIIKYNIREIDDKTTYDSVRIKNYNPEDPDVIVKINGRNLSTLVPEKNIVGTENADNLESKLYATSITALEGNDTIINRGDISQNIYGNEGKDTITNYGRVKGSIKGGTDNDIITTEKDSSSGSIIFNAGDGHDTLYLKALDNNLIFPEDDEKTYSWKNDDLIIKYNINADEGTYDSVTIKDYNPYNLGVIVNVNDVNLNTLIPEMPQNKYTDSQELASQDESYTYVPSIDKYLTVSGNNGDDTIYGDANNVIVLGGDGNDEINLSGVGNLIYGGHGNDYISGWEGEGVDSKTIFFNNGDGDDTVSMWGDICTLKFNNTYIDSLYLERLGYDLFIKYNGGNDSVRIRDCWYKDDETGAIVLDNKAIVNCTVEDNVGNQRSLLTWINNLVDIPGAYITQIDGTDTDDNIEIPNGISSITVYGNNGDDTIYGDADYIAIYGGYGNDEIHLSGTGNIIIGGSGNDYISGWEGDGVDSKTIFFFNGDGDDTVSIWRDYCTLKFIDTSFDNIYLEKIGYDLVIRYNDGIDSVRIRDCWYKNDETGAIVLDNEAIVNCTVEDNIGNQRSLLNWINNSGDIPEAYVTQIEGTDTDDNIEIPDGISSITVYGNNGDDSICGNANNVVIYGGDGNDEIHLSGKGNQIFGGSGNDYISGWEGEGVDSKTIFFYKGDGDDTVSMWRDVCKLKFVDTNIENISLEKLGYDLFIKYNDGNDSIRIKECWYKNDETGAIILDNEGIANCSIEDSAGNQRSLLDYINSYGNIPEKTITEINGTKTDDYIEIPNVINHDTEYNVSILNRSVITDVAGDDILNINTNLPVTSDLRVLFNVYNFYKITDGIRFGNISIIEEGSVDKWKNNSYYKGVIIENNAVETINFNSKKITSTEIAQLAQSVAGWLTSDGRHYEDVNAVLNSENEADINSLLTYFSENTNWHE